MPELEDNALGGTRMDVSNPTLTGIPVKETESPNPRMKQLEVLEWILDPDFIAKANEAGTRPEL